MTRTSTFRTVVGLIVLSSFLAVGHPTPAATPPITDTGRYLRSDIAPYPESDYIRDLIERAQRALTALGLYDGPINGEVDPLLVEAIDQFQLRRGGRGSNQIDEQLVERLESSVDVETLLDRLAEIRERKARTARSQLLSNPATRGLLEHSPTDDIADVTRDSAACFVMPDSKCLLNEATESAKAVATDGRRDWAFGEILVAQVLAGLHDDALSTTRRITDPRLIIVALRRIAVAEAEAGRAQSAIDAIPLIPDPAEQSLARTSVALTLSKLGNHTAALQAAAPVLSTGLTRDAASRSSLVPVLAAGDRRDEADHLLVNLVLEARTVEDPGERGSHYRRIAMAFLNIGEADTALAMLEQIGSESDRNTVLMSAAVQFAAQQRADDAFAVAAQVAGARYQAVAFAGIAEHIAKHDRKTASSALHKARDIAESVRLPFARDYALSRLSLAHAMVSVGDKTVAVELARSIGDPVLKAETLWRLHLEHGRPVLPDAEAACDRIQGAFNLAWLYAELADRVRDRSAAGGPSPDGQALFGRALALAEDIKTPWARARLLARLAVTYGRFLGP